MNILTEMKRECGFSPFVSFSPIVLVALVAIWVWNGVYAA
jgi:hypothetical protein